MYFHGVETMHNGVERNFDRPQMSIPNGFLIFAQKARTLGAPVYDMLSLSDFKKIQWYILNNCEMIESYLNLHKEELQRQSITNVQHRHQDEFPSWFKQYVVQKNLRGSLESINHLYVLGLGPDMRVAKYSGIIVHGIRFHNIEREKYRHTQNSGIVVKGEHNSEEIDFYGELTDIIELEYYHGNCVYVFKCNWWNTGDKKNRSRTYGQLMSVNVNQKSKMKSYPRNVYDVPENEGIDNERFDFNNEPYQQYEINDGNVIEQIDNQDIKSLHHDDEILEEIHATTILLRNSRKSSEDN
ncbi:hypothetical protein GH714_034765 [Hevea brasiliensis]|uniref:DUF4216 domain-containing protein n=1 Tax=Hevea brasiliensis TaxID=3981 RepID=A0A6A6N741_HEVBR|nr:hypothetical protein GH714_034765 [Hevea brasiliensis]